MSLTSVEDKIGKLESELIHKVPLVENRIPLIQELLKTKQESSEDIPIPSVLVEEDWSQDDVVNSEHFLRNVIKTVKDSDAAGWRELLDSCTEQQGKMLEEFTSGEKIENIFEKFDFGSSRGTRQELAELEKAKTLEVSFPLVDSNLGLFTEQVNTYNANGGGAQLAPQPQFHAIQKQVDVQLFEDAAHKKKLLAYVDATFNNWGQNIQNNPEYTFVPQTTYAIQQIVQFAADRGFGVRVSGYRHSWSPSFARKKGCVLISTLNLRTATTLPNTASLAGVSQFLFGPPNYQLNRIEMKSPPKKKGDKALVRVGCATTNEQLRSWCIDHEVVTLPLNVIMVEITFGGSNAPICHGAGRMHKTLSDLVREIEYVDVHGQLRTINDKEELRAASGCFGLIGVITHLTFELDPMSFAVMKPVKVDVIDAVPPPPSMSRNDIPEPLQKSRTEEQIKKAQQDFENRATNHYYSEWFWFPYSDQIWLNTWETSSDKSGVKGYPSKKQIAFQWLQAIGMEALQKTGGVGLISTTAVSRLGMAALPDKQTIKTWLPDALHFRRAIQNTRVRDMEIEIPLPPKGDDSTKPDYAVVQQAWWDAIIETYKASDKAPMRMPLEMRIMGDSNVVMAPQRGNTLGTCAVEVLTLEYCAEIWPPFAQTILDKWMDLRTFGGHKLNIRPHWAKEWHDLKVDKKPFIEYLRDEAYKDEIKEFNGILEGIGKKQGWTRKDLKRMFSNEMLDSLFFIDIAG